MLPGEYEFDTPVLNGPTERCFNCCGGVKIPQQYEDRAKFLKILILQHKLQSKSLYTEYIKRSYKSTRKR